TPRDKAQFLRWFIVIQANEREEREIWDWEPTGCGGQKNVCLTLDLRMMPESDVRLTGESGAVRQGRAQRLECVEQPAKVLSGRKVDQNGVRWEGGQGSLSRLVFPDDSPAR
ncbi:hypothetical protein XENOCAPTIV_025831, partial [Xenoophorus captivus]